MTEWKLYQGDVAHVSTSEFHEHRERATHLEQEVHRPRLEHAAQLVRMVGQSVSDLGCGDGGLLSLIPDLDAWGYDFAPANVAGWDERGVRAEFLDVFGADRDKVVFGVTTVVTEVLEHLTDPHAELRWIVRHSPFIVASSPWTENDQHHDECHAWAWDQNGYRDLVEQAGYRVLRHDLVNQFQIILGMQA